MQKSSSSWAIIFVALLVILIFSSYRSEASNSYFSEFTLPAGANGPTNVSLESDNRIWFTMPEVNALGRLVVTSTVDYHFDVYTITTTPGSVPYDVSYAGGYVWFTEQVGNKIGRLDLASGHITEFPVGATPSAPTGIAVAPDASVWFTKRDANQVAQLIVTDTLNFQIKAYTLTVPEGKPQDVFVWNNDTIWATAPGHNRIWRITPSNAISPTLSVKPQFPGVTAPYTGTPYNIVVDSAGFPWFTDPATNYVLKYFPQTLGLTDPYPISTPGSQPAGIALGTDGTIWFAQQAEAANRVARISPLPKVINEYSMPTSNTQPTGLAVGNDGRVWVAEKAVNKIGLLQPPYFQFVFLPIVIK